MKVFDQLRDLFVVQRKLLSDRSLSELSKDLEGDPQFIFLSPKVIHGIRKYPDRYISKALVTYVKLLNHEVVISNPVKSEVRPKRFLEKSKMAYIKRKEDQLDLVKNAVVDKKSIEHIRFYMEKDGIKSDFSIVVPKGSNVLMSVIEHLQEEIELAKPLRTVADMRANDRVREKRKRVNRKNQLRVA